jgi:formylglycine-generating enzyme required for sulfatase activity
MQTFKLFVSSPGDVMVERRRVENVVSRLNGEFAGVARLEAIRWETEFYQAYSTFQAQIPRSTDCDLVIGILKWRLGTELPPEFNEKLPSGQPFPSGTAYEILTAIAKRQKGVQHPDIYVFRFVGSSPSVAVEDPNRERIEHDWQVLKGFFQEWFLTERGHFKAAFNPYSSEDDFETQLEKLLRNWVADKVTGGRVVRWPIEVKGSPFRGLAAFGAKHAPVFFGRSHDTARAVDLWREAGSRGSPYLLVVGASGSGKSSLARAALVPRLTMPGVIREVDVWRIAVMRPGDSPAGPFAALATALMQDEAGLPKEEEGRGPALPEIEQGDSRTPAELASVLRHVDAAAVKPIVNALSRVAAGEHDRESYSREVRCDLVLLIDQFEELFAASVSEVERTGFIDLIAALVETCRVWVVATLRADFYARMLDQPALKKLKELGATYDLASPGPVELTEIVRAPAEAAGLVFETDAASGERLDARLLRDADRPDMLPLVQLALSRLFEGRESVGDETRLPLKVYEGLGGLKGIVEEAGETALASLGEAEKTRLPRLLRQLAVPAHDQDGTEKGALTIRAVPLAQAAPDDTGRRLLDALVTARLLTTSGIEADAQVRLAHQRVLEDWARARTIVAENADFYRIRAEVEEQRRRWEAARRSRDFLVGRGRPLAEAESIIRRFAEELPPATCDFIKRSGRHARLRQTLSAAVLIGIIAGLVGWINQSYLKEQMNWYMTMRPYMLAYVRPYVLTAEAESALKPLASFRECAKDCSEMIVIPAGEFIMGSPATETGHEGYEDPQHEVTIAKRFAVSKFDLTFADWDACVSVGGCPQVGDSKMGRGARPVVNVTWDDAQHYVAWFSKMTGQPYRLLTEAEWEYAARAGSKTAYYWGDELGKGNAACNGCGSQWDNHQTSPVGSFKPNAFGLCDMAGNVWQMVQDCFNWGYKGAPTDGSAWTSGDCGRHVVRGGAMGSLPQTLRSAARSGLTAEGRFGSLGFRVARTLTP